MQAPELVTQRLRLRPLGVDCQRLYERFYGDAEASRFYSGPLSPKATWTRLLADAGSWWVQGFGVWALQAKAGGELLGVCGFWQAPDWPRELTWWLLPEARGAGLAQEASRAALHCAYRDWGWPEVQTYMADDNLAARKLVERIGGRKLRRIAFPDGQDRDLFHLPCPQDAP